jgi:hypothetical protein
LRGDQNGFHVYRGGVQASIAIEPRILLALVHLLLQIALDALPFQLAFSSH